MNILAHALERLHAQGSPGKTVQMASPLILFQRIIIIIAVVLSPIALVGDLGSSRGGLGWPSLGPSNTGGQR